MFWLALLAATPAQARMSADIDAGRPLVAHVTVALADSKHQNIGPVKGDLGDGMRPDVNLYWGALYGVAKFLPRQGWRVVKRTTIPDRRVLSRVVFERRIRRDGRSIRAIVVADAWAGPNIEDAIDRYFGHVQGRDVELVSLGEERVNAGAGAHVAVFVGHNGLMDFDAPDVGRREGHAVAAIALACITSHDFLPLLERAGAEPILLTRTLMAPEAYTLDAALKTWFSGGDAQAVYVAGSDTYCAYQKCSRRTGRKVFWAPGASP